MSSMSDRKAELERKKAKLQALRDEKDRRRREKEQKDAEEALVRFKFCTDLLTKLKFLYYCFANMYISVTNVII